MRICANSRLPASDSLCRYCSGSCRMVDILIYPFFYTRGQCDKGQAELIAVLTDAATKTHCTQATHWRIVRQQEIHIEFGIQTSGRLVFAQLIDQILTALDLHSGWRQVHQRSCTHHTGNLQANLATEADSRVFASFVFHSAWFIGLWFFSDYGRKSISLRNQCSEVSQVTLLSH